MVELKGLKEFASPQIYALVNTKVFDKNSLSINDCGNKTFFSPKICLSGGDDKVDASYSDHPVEGGTEAGLHDPKAKTHNHNEHPERSI